VASRATAKPPTPARLRRRALYYLERFAASRARLGLVLRRRALRDATALELPTAPVAEAIEALLDDLERLGLLDDAAFAVGRARSLAAKGRPPRRIARELAAAGVEPLLIEAALHRLADERGDTQAALELDAAVAFARRRRLGPFGPTDAAAKPRDKALAAFARAGFTLEVARRVLDARSGEFDDCSRINRI
jgi:regulatory protein